MNVLLLAIGFGVFAALVVRGAIAFYIDITNTKGRKK